MTGTARTATFTSASLWPNAHSASSRLRITLLLTVCLLALVTVGCNVAGSQPSNSQTTTTTPPPPPPPPPTNVAPNQLPITVSAGTGTTPDMNRPLATVTICGPGTTTCQTINNVLVDTGSIGLRLFSSVVNIPLATQPTLYGEVYECYPFENTSAWGKVVNADIHLSGEIASNASIQLMGDTTYPVPASCINGQAANSTPQQSGFNGILGVFGLADCGSMCTSVGNNLYWACAASACQAFQQGPPQPVANPVSLFPTDNNGVLFDVPGITSAGAANVQGSVYFGIGTQSNNQLGSAVQYQAPFFTQIYGSTYSVGIDSGTPTLGVLNDGLVGGLPVCGVFYCPSSPVNLTYEIVGTNGAAFNANLTAADPTAVYQQGMTADQQLMGPGFNGNTIMLGFPFFYNMKLFFSWANPATGSTNYVAF